MHDVLQPVCVGVSPEASCAYLPIVITTHGVTTPPSAGPAGSHVSPTKRESRVGLRAFLIGVAASAFIGLSVPYAYLFLDASRPAYSHLPIAPLVILLVLMSVGNRALRALSPRLMLNRQELLLIYAMTLATAALASAGYAAWVTTVPTSPFYYANPENRWQETFFKFIPSWFHPDEAVIDSFYERLHAGEPIPWTAWRLPLLVWTCFTFCFFLMFLFWSLLFRPRWMESEKLLFPLAEIPLTLAGASGGSQHQNNLLRSRMLWMGFAIPAAFHIFNGLHTYFPLVPQLKIHDVDIGEPFVQRPFNQLRDLRLYVLFSVIGVAYLLAAEISGGMWFFYWFFNSQRVAIEAFGHGDRPAWWIPRRQAIGAFFALVGFLLWTARKEFLQRIKAGLQRGWWRRDGPLDLTSYPVALVGFLLSLAGVLFFSKVAGGRLLPMMLFWITFLVVATTLCRLVSAGGVIFVECDFMPKDVLDPLVGTKWQGGGVADPDGPLRNDVYVRAASHPDALPHGFLARGTGRRSVGSLDAGWHGGRFLRYRSSRLLHHHIPGPQEGGAQPGRRLVRGERATVALRAID